MATEIKVPSLGESIAEATVAKWLKAVGDAVTVDEPLVVMETDKAAVEVNSPASGILSAITSGEGSDVEVGAVIGLIAEGALASKPALASKVKPEPAPVLTETTPLAPAVRKLVAEHQLDAAAIAATGKDGRLTKGDVLAHLDGSLAAAKPKAASTPASIGGANHPPRAADPREERVRMSRLRKMVAARLKEAQNTAAILTTFNEVDMTALIAIRAAHKDAFEKKHGAKIGFMSFFVKAAVTALCEFPGVNAEIDGDDIIYKNYYDIGIAVGSPQGLVVPVLRNASALSFAEIEIAIRNFGQKARDGKLTMDEMQGGTFTITNGGIFGSMLSTPILNRPQSGILGMHNIVKRAVVMPDDTIQARPVMYLALSYDHRIIDGREAVSFLVRVKQSIEDPERILLNI